MSTETLLRPTGKGDLTECPHGYLADGSKTYPDWVDFYSLVDEETFSADRIACIGAEKRCLFTFTPGILGSIIEAITIYIKGSGKWYDGQHHTAYYRPVIKSNESYAYGNYVDLEPYMAWTEYSQEFSLNPATGVAWTLSDISSMQLGCALSSDHSSMEALCGQFWIAVRHRPSSQCRAQIIGLW